MTAQPAAVRTGPEPSGGAEPSGRAEPSGGPEPSGQAEPSGEAEPSGGAGPSGEAAFRREIGGRIRAERSLRNLRQEELARRAGVSRNFVSAIERGTQRLDAWRLVHLARALDCDLCRLLDGSRPAPRPGAGRDETAR